MNEKRKGIWKAVVLTVLFMSAQVLLKEDGKVFAVWWLTILVLGWCSFPLCQYLFSGFRDRGYLVAKIFGIAGAGFLMWLGAMKFPFLMSYGSRNKSDYEDDL